MTSYHDTGAIEAEISNIKAAPRARVDAARKALWVAESDWKFTEDELLLVRMIASRLLDGIEMREIASRDLVAAWKVTPLVPPHGPFTPDQQTPAQALIVAKLLYERGDATDAEPFFSRVLQTSTATARTALLAAYNLERYGRQNRLLPVIGRALEIVRQPDFDSLVGADEAAAEVKHCSGHLNILRAQFANRPASGYAELGSDLLRQAADMDPSYTSCYTSSFAERGDYVGTVEASLESLQRRQFATLDPRESVLVALEVLFYLAYALSCVGEYERARVCFAAFAERASSMDEYEARDHARLFMVKLDLKKRFSREIMPHELRSYFQELRELSFRSPFSIPVGEETRRYEDVLDFLMALPSQAANVSNTRDVKFQQEIPDNKEFDLTEAYQRGRAVLRRLTHERPNLARQPLGLLVALGTQEGEVAAYDCIAEFPMLWAVKIAHTRTELSRIVADSSEAFDVLGIWVQDPAELDSAAEVLEWTRRTAPTYCAQHSTSPHLVMFDSDETFRGVLTVGAALALAKRFLLDDEYIFGLNPCIDSPAVKFQIPKYSLTEIRA
jgi:hypothetical protein